MKVYIKNKLISIGEGSAVLDDEGRVLFNVKGRVFSLSKRKMIYNSDGALLYTVRNRRFNLLSHRSYVFDARGKRLATVHKGLWSLSRNYRILDTDEPMEITGKLVSLTSHILRSGEVVGVIKRSITVLRDCFSLEASPEDIPFLTALVIAYDNITDDRQRDRAR